MTTSLRINQKLFMMAFGRDEDYHDPYPLKIYLDKETGDIEWVYENDTDAEMEGLSSDENFQFRQQVRTSPARYLHIPGLAHGQHHEILQDFLGTDFSNDTEVLSFVRSAYYGMKSIGGWIKEINDQSIVEQYHRFREERTIQMAEVFLSEHNLKFTWK